MHVFEPTSFLCTPHLVLNDGPCDATAKYLALLLQLPCPQSCQGTGVQVHLRPLGPGMMQQIQSRCSTCGGNGYSCPPSKAPVAEGVGGALAIIDANCEPAGPIVMRSGTTFCLRGSGTERKSAEHRMALNAMALSLGTPQQATLQLPALCLLARRLCSMLPPTQNC